MQTQKEPIKKRSRYGLWIAVTGMLLAGSIGLRHRHDQRVLEDGKDEHEIAAEFEAKVANLPPAARLAALTQGLQDPDSAVRTAAVDPLAALSSPAATEAVEAAFQDSAATVREAALQALPKMDKERGLRLELAAMVDDDLWVREAAISQLEATPHKSVVDSRAIPTLLRALDDSSPTVQTTAMGVLRRITGNDWRCSSLAKPEVRQATAQRWKQWWAGAAPKPKIPAEFNVVAQRPPTRTDPAPDFQLTDTEGKRVSLASEQGKIVLLNFWGTWCPPCQKEIPDLIRLDAAYRSKGLDIVGVALSEKDGAEGLRKSCAEHGILYRQALAVDDVLDAYGHVHGVPVSVLIDAHGKIRNRWEGERDFNTFQAAVERALQK